VSQHVHSQRKEKWISPCWWKQWKKVVSLVGWL